MIAPANLLQHPLSAAFPHMQDADYAALRASIDINGVLNPITLHEGMVIDGWHRYKAATELGMDCEATELDIKGFDAGFPRDFVLAQNKHRRHITAAQLAMATTAVYQWKPAHRADNSTLNVKLTKSSAELATMAGVHVNTITQAKAVQTHAVPEVQAAVKAGAVGLPKAAAIAKLPKAEQAAALNKPIKKLSPQKVMKQSWLQHKSLLKQNLVNKDVAPVQVAVAPNEDYTELDAAQDQIRDLQAMLAVANMGDVSPEDKNQATNLIAELREENRKLQANLDAVTTSRNSLMNELAMVKRQCISLQFKLKKAV